MKNLLFVTLLTISISASALTFNEAQTLIIVSGYRCDHVDAVTPFVFGDGFNVYCNQYKYHYEIKDEGGNLVVTAD